MTLQLTDTDAAWLEGAYGDAGAMAMRILVSMAEVYGADRLLDIESAHIDGCLYHGPSGLDFAERLVAGGGTVRVPTSLNVGALDLVHPGRVHGKAEDRARAKRLMDAYLAMGCRSTWTCAPYQTGHRPGFGAQVAWAESNAIVFANSVLGARTERYGDFIDICAAITGRAPAVGLHLDENRRGQVLFRLVGIPEHLLRDPVLGPVLGYLVGRAARSRIPVIEGLPRETTEDTLKALGAAAASSGAVALFHAIGITPEAPSLAAAFGDQEPDEIIEVDRERLRETLGALSTVPSSSTLEPNRGDTAGHGADAGHPIHVVALGSPHFSVDELAAFVPLVERFPPQPDVEVYVCTNRIVLEIARARGWLEILELAGVTMVADTCVVVTPIVRRATGVLMTNSGKFAHYTPGNLGLDVLFGSLEECARSAHAGHVWRDPGLWQDEAPRGHNA